MVMTLTCDRRGKSQHLRETQVCQTLSLEGACVIAAVETTHDAT